jgi:exonuclease III
LMTFTTRAQARHSTLKTPPSESSAKSLVALKVPRRQKQPQTGVPPDQKPREDSGPLRKLQSKPAPRAGKKGRSVRLELATWNTLGYATRTRHIVQALKQDVIALTECVGVHKHAGSDLLVGDPPTDGDPSGVSAIHLSKRAQRMVINSGHKGSRLVWVRLAGLFCNQFIVSAYIPHKARKQAPFREDTLEELQELLTSEAMKGDCVIVMGDMNSKLARNQRGVTGKYCMHPRADEGGERLAEIMQTHNLFAASTYFCPQKSAPLGQATYITKSDKTVVSQIDYMLVSTRWLSSVRSCKVVWAQTVERHIRRFDHGMITAVFHLRIAAQKPKKAFPDSATRRTRLHSMRHTFKHAKLSRWTEKL